MHARSHACAHTHTREYTHTQRHTYTRIHMSTKAKHQQLRSSLQELAQQPLSVIMTLRTKDTILREVSLRTWGNAFVLIKVKFDFKILLVSEVFLLLPETRFGSVWGCLQTFVPSNSVHLCINISSCLSWFVWEIFKNKLRFLKMEVMKVMKELTMLGFQKLTRITF